MMIPAVFGILAVVWPWGRGGVGGLPFAALALQLGMGRPRGPRSFSPLLGLLPLSLPHLGCLALALEVLIDLPLPEEEAPDVLGREWCPGAPSRESCAMHCALQTARWCRSGEVSCRLCPPHRTSHPTPPW